MKRLTNSRKNLFLSFLCQFLHMESMMRKQEEVFLFPQEKGLVKLIIIPVDARHAVEKIERTLVNPSSWSAG